MSVVVWTNNASGTLAAAITSTQTTITVNSGEGALFPAPTSGQFFPITLISASNASTREIVYCTSRTSDTLTVTRGEEGTNKLTFNQNDLVNLQPTAGTLTISAMGRLLNIQHWTTHGTFTYTPTPGATAAEIFGGGAGGGGAPAGAAGSGQSVASSGGSAGSFGQKRITSGLTTTTVTIGTGGASGVAGGATSFGAICSFPGGLAGVSGNAESAPAVSSSSPNFAAAPTGVDSGSPGALGAPGLTLSALCAFGGAGGNSPYGTGASANGVNGTGSQAGNGGVGNCSGGGGAAGVNNGGTPAGGAGTDGILIIWEYS